MRKLFFTMAATAALCMAVPKPAQAALLATNTVIQQGDKLFTNFTCSVTGTGADCGTINVIGSTDASGNFGLLFQVGAFNNTPGTLTDILISYDAFVTTAGYRISDVHLGFNGAVTGTGFINVTETVFGLVPLTAFNIGQVFVQNPPPILDAAINLTQLATAVHVTKDILLAAGAGPGSAALSTVSQYLSQVPEPASMALFGLAAMGAAIRRRRLA